MIRFLFILICTVMCSSALLAKPRQPMDTQLVITNSVVFESDVEYTLVYQCKPWVDSNDITFQLNLPAGFELEQGFSYWEGELKANIVFSRELKIKAPIAHTGVLKITAIMKLENAQCVKVSTVTLDKKAIKSKATPLPFSFGSGSRRSKNLKHRILRE